MCHCQNRHFGNCAFGGLEGQVFDEGGLARAGFAQDKKAVITGLSDEGEAVYALEGWGRRWLGSQGVDVEASPGGGFFEDVEVGEDVNEGERLGLAEDAGGAVAGFDAFKVAPEGGVPVGGVGRGWRSRGDSASNADLGGVVTSALLDDGDGVAATRDGEFLPWTLAIVHRCPAQSELTAARPP